jgi:hypothetical protein
MQITSLEAYNEACHLIPKRELPPELKTIKDTLDKELEILHKHLSYLESDLDRMEIMAPGDVGALAGKRDQMEPVKTKILQKENEIKRLYVAPYAQKVWEEGESIQHYLKSQIQEGYSRAYTLKEEYLSELAKIGQLRKESEQIAGQVSGVRLNMLPTRNNMEPIKLSNLHSFTVAPGDIDKAFRG